MLCIGDIKIISIARGTVITVYFKLCHFKISQYFRSIFSNCFIEICLKMFRRSLFVSNKCVFFCFFLHNINKNSSKTQFLCPILCQCIIIRPSHVCRSFHCLTLSLPYIVANSDRYRWHKNCDYTSHLDPEAQYCFSNFFLVRIWFIVQLPADPHIIYPGTSPHAVCKHIICQKREASAMGGLIIRVCIVIPLEGGYYPTLTHPAMYSVYSFWPQCQPRCDAALYLLQARAQQKWRVGTKKNKVVSSAVQQHTAH